VFIGASASGEMSRDRERTLRGPLDASDIGESFASNPNASTCRKSDPSARERAIDAFCDYVPVDAEEEMRAAADSFHNERRLNQARWCRSERDRRGAVPMNP
jgi:hypothetical protein